MEVIQFKLAKEDCPNCQALIGVMGTGEYYLCPGCNLLFCSQCFEPIDDGDGHSIECPRCETILRFPE